MFQLITSSLNHVHHQPTIKNELKEWADDKLINWNID